ncbi:MAG: HEPN domain-containing protein [Defluviitaleaceae bacterium]|nr:HEPN domain-containing protein [Defluviitaleaceae bacterium]
MNGKYSYKDIAKEDLLAAKEMLRAGLYNHTAMLCQQYTEKIFKECLVNNGTEEQDMLLLHIHKLARLSSRCGELLNISFTSQETAFFREITDCYLCTDYYPGENYIKLSEAEAAEIYDKTLLFQAKHEITLLSRNEF